MRSLSYRPSTPHSAGGMLSPALLTVSTLSRHKDTSGACCRRKWKGSRPGCLFHQTVLAFAPESHLNAQGAHARAPRESHLNAQGAHARAPRAEHASEADGSPRPSAGHPVSPWETRLHPRSSPDRSQVCKNPHRNVAPQACVGLKPVRVLSFCICSLGSQFCAAKPVLIQSWLAATWSFHTMRSPSRLQSKNNLSLELAGNIMSRGVTAGASTIWKILWILVFKKPAFKCTFFTLVEGGGPVSQSAPLLHIFSPTRPPVGDRHSRTPGLPHPCRQNSQREQQQLCYCGLSMHACPQALSSH